MYYLLHVFLVYGRRIFQSYIVFFFNYAISFILYTFIDKLEKKNQNYFLLFFLNYASCFDGLFHLIAFLYNNILTNDSRFSTFLPHICLESLDQHENICIVLIKRLQLIFFFSQNDKWQMLKKKLKNSLEYKHHLKLIYKFVLLQKH